MNCQEMAPLLAGSAAGALEPEEERRLREHVRTCVACAERLQEFSEISAAFACLSVPPPPSGLMERTRSLLEAESAIRADRRQAAVLAGSVGVAGWVLALCLVYLWSLYFGEVGWLWLAWWSLPPLVAAPAAAALRRARLERSAA